MSDKTREQVSKATPGAWRTFSLCMDIDGFMRNHRYPRGYDVFERDDGTPMSPPEALAFLTMEKAKGYKVIPCSAECGNPCKHASCSGFDYSGGGCGGRSAAESRQGGETS